MSGVEVATLSLEVIVAGSPVSYVAHLHASKTLWVPLQLGLHIILVPRKAATGQLFIAVIEPDISIPQYTSFMLRECS